MREQHGAIRESRSRARSPRAFTMVELLVVIGLIIIMVTLLIVALASASGRAGAARTSAIMQTMAQGMAAFKNDFGGYPPVLGHPNPSDPNDMRNMLPLPPANDYARLQGWFSITSPADYLLGYGQGEVDGYGYVQRSPPEIPVAGIRTPGVDRYWGGSRDVDGDGTPGEFEDRVAALMRNPPRGQVYGPYIELNDERFIGSFDINTGLVSLPSQNGYNPDHPKVIVDYWGEPIRFYVDHPDPQMNLGDVIVLRPWTMERGAEAASSWADASGSIATTYSLKSAPFALLSTGEDRTGNAFLRVDDPDDPNNDPGDAFGELGRRNQRDPGNAKRSSFANEDNIVEVGQ